LSKFSVNKEEEPLAEMLLLMAAQFAQPLACSTEGPSSIAPHVGSTVVSATGPGNTFAAVNPTDAATIHSAKMDAANCCINANDPKTAIPNLLKLRFSF